MSTSFSGLQKGQAKAKCACLACMARLSLQAQRLGCRKPLQTCSLHDRLILAASDLLWGSSQQQKQQLTWVLCSGRSEGGSSALAHESLRGRQPSWLGST